MSDEPRMERIAKTETTVRHFDLDGKVVREIVTTVVHNTQEADNKNTGLYL